MTLQTLPDIFLNLEGKHQEVIVDRQAERDIRRKLKVPEFAKECGNKAFACRKFGISRETFYQWKRAYEAKGEADLVNSKPCPQNPKLRTPPHIEEKILYLRTTYHFGPVRISWYLHRYHGIQISSNGVYSRLKRNGMNRLPEKCRKRSIQSFQRYEKKCPATTSRWM